MTRIVCYSVQGHLPFLFVFQFDTDHRRHSVFSLRSTSVAVASDAALIATLTPVEEGN